MIEPEFESERSVRGRVELLTAWTPIIEMAFGDLLCLFAPGRIEDDAAKVSPSKFWVEQREHVIVHGSESRLRLVAESIVKGVDDLLLEVIPARMRLDYRFPVSVGHIKVANPENSISTPAVTMATSGFLCLGNARRGVQCDGVPNHINSWLISHAGRRKARAALALSTSKRSVALRYSLVRPMS